MKFPQTTNLKLTKYKIKQIIEPTWNEIHGKHNWNKEGFRAYLGCCLKEVVLLLDPQSFQSSQTFIDPLEEKHALESNKRHHWHWEWKTF